MGAVRKVQLNLMILPETKERIEAMARATFRGMGDTVDWAISEMWAGFPVKADPEEARGEAQEEQA
jgi:hypothetical protein